MVLRFALNDEAKERGIKLSAPRRMDAGIDLPCLRDTEIQPGGAALVHTGVHIAIPEGWVGLVRDRSSVALRGGVTAAGVIDAAYRGEVKVLMYNLGKEPLSFRTGERIAQCVIIPHLEGSDVLEASSLEGLGETERGEGGFGSTGS